MVASISAVAAIWQTAPTTIQPSAAALGVTTSPVTTRTTTRKTSPNGRPNRKRIWVAPTVPSRSVRLRWVALRKVWAVAASEGEDHPQPGRSRHARR